MSNVLLVETPFPLTTMFPSLWPTFATASVTTFDSSRWSAPYYPGQSTEAKMFLAELQNSQSAVLLRTARRDLVQNPSRTSCFTRREVAVGQTAAGNVPLDTTL